MANKNKTQETKRYINITNEMEKIKVDQFAEVVTMIQQTKASVISIANTALIDL